MIQQTNLDPSITNKTADLVSGLTSYILLFEDDEIDIPDDNSQVIKAESFEEAADFLRLLGDSCLPLLSSEYRRIHPGIYERLIDIASSERSAEAPFNIGQAELLLNKLPLDLKSLTKSHIALRSDDKAPPLIDKSYVHKNLDANVLVSEPFITGWLRYFNIFTNTTEFNFDHDSDHIQGMLLLEALRQAGIASAHYQGLPLDGKLALLNYNTKFFQFLDKEAPIICRTYCSFTTKESDPDKEACIYIQVMQWGRLCADTILKAFACMNKTRCDVKEDRLKKILTRQKVNFESKVEKFMEC